jgi:predicted enzyme related to lactoylglutathione lyase
LLLALWLLLAMQAGADNPRLPGKFVWTELVTYDTALSKAFYGQLFDWQFDDEGDYRVAWSGEEAVGGIVHRPRKNLEGKSRWIAYISVEQMDAVKAALQEAGAQLLADSRQVAGLGELAVFADPEGALFGVIDTTVPDPADYLAQIGDWIWIQLFSRDAEQACGFYEKAGGYERFDNPLPGSCILARAGYARAVISTISAQHPDATPAWVPFVRVADIAATLEKAESLGGVTLVAPRADLYDNRVAMIEAPDGSAVGILVWEAEDAEVSP